MKISFILIVTIILSLLSVMISAQISDFKERGGPQAGDFKERGRGRGRGRGRRPSRRGFGSCDKRGASRCVDLRRRLACPLHIVDNTCVCFNTGNCMTLSGTNACQACTTHRNAVTAKENFRCGSRC